MSLYNLIHGENSNADLLLAILGLERSDVPRYRDCYLSGDTIAIHTRTGGGNRNFYEHIDRCRNNYPEYFKGNNDDPKGPWNSDLRKLPTFQYDEDDDFDSTYATFYFGIPAELKSALEGIESADATPAQRWQSFFDKLRDPAKHDDPQVQRTIKAMEPVIKAIADKVKP